MYVTKIGNKLIFSGGIINNSTLKITQEILNKKPNAVAELDIKNNQLYWKIIQTLEEKKAEIITNSKKELQNYLQDNPLEWKNKKLYSITLEKQQLLQIQLVLYSQAKLNNLNYKLMWNAHGEVLEEWKYEDLLELSLKINEKVQPLVQYQQLKEIEVKNCQSIDDLNKIIINYNNVSNDI